MAATGRKRQGLLLLLFSIVFSLFLMTHSAIVGVDYEACFSNYGAAINGERPYLRAGEMSFGALMRAAGGQLSTDGLIIGALGLLPLSPFLIAWRFSERAPVFWVASALLSLIVMIVAISTRSLTEFYDCDLNGVSLGLLFAPILYLVANMIAVAGLAVLYYLMLLFVVRA